MNTKVTLFVYIYIFSHKLELTERMLGYEQKKCLHCLCLGMFEQKTIIGRLVLQTSMIQSVIMVYSYWPKPASYNRYILNDIDRNYSVFKLHEGKAMAKIRTPNPCVFVRFKMRYELSKCTAVSWLFVSSSSNKGFLPQQRSHWGR